MERTPKLRFEQKTCNCLSNFSVSVLMYLIKYHHFSDVKQFYISILKEDKMKANTLESIHTQLHPAFQMAVRDGLIRMNPSDGVMAEIKKSKLWEKPKRHALTVPQQKAFMDFLKEDREHEGWLPVVTVLLGTGMRIGECLGLRWEDLDFENRIISVNHNLTDRPDDNVKCGKHIQSPKTAAGNSAKSVWIKIQVQNSGILRLRHCRILKFVLNL